MTYGAVATHAWILHEVRVLSLACEPRVQTMRFAQKYVRSLSVPTIRWQGSKHCGKGREPLDILLKRSGNVQPSLTQRTAHTASWLLSTITIVHQHSLNIYGSARG